MKEEYQRTLCFYDRISDSYSKSTAGVVLEEQIGEFISSVKKDGRVIDVACGPGHDSCKFASSGLTCEGIDGSSKMIGIAQDVSRGLPRVNFRVMDVLTMDYSNDSFDGAWCSSILVHLSPEDSFRLLDRIKYMLKKGGTLGIITAANQIRIPDKDDNRYYTMYNSQELVELIEGVGYVVNKLSTFVYGRERIFALATKL